MRFLSEGHGASWGNLLVVREKVASCGECQGLFLLAEAIKIPRQVRWGECCVISRFFDYMAAVFCGGVLAPDELYKIHFGFD